MVADDTLTAPQVWLLATSTRQHPEIIWLLASVGLRWGEMAALRPCDLDFNRNRIRVRRSASKVNGRTVIGPVKTWEARTVVVAAEIMAMLKPLSVGKPRTALLWERPTKGGPLRPPTTTHWFTFAVIRAQAADPTFPEHLNVHRLRHTAASLMIQQGQNIKKVQRQLGHKSAEMTFDRYGHLYGDDLDEIGFAMGAALGLSSEDRGQSVGTPVAPTLSAS
ncbi:site-specific integrase [Nocardia seriolae]|uniref:site-specific integrase n=1 Tax=Nocardia seriolae TaxID=37332 RepID=UPI00210D33BB|nr:site-specific integrase [Nocardia seriolae]